MESVCVFCSSQIGNNPAFADAARALGSELARRGLRMVYGGSDSGLMGITARSALTAGGEVIGVIPEKIHHKVSALEITRLIVVKTMHERKAVMFEHADGFIALPGGIGTLEEWTEVYTWLQLGYSRKPVGLLNIGGFFDPLLAFFDSMVNNGLMKGVHRRMMKTASEPEAVLDMLENFTWEYHDKW
jgi:uncharacterized protein (TIGR00730 family)